MQSDERPFRRWMCTICGWIYDEAVGDPEHGLAPGTRWEDFPFNWRCPDCGVDQSDFDEIEPEPESKRWYLG
jgi:rubredoxin